MPHSRCAISNAVCLFNKPPSTNAVNGGRLFHRERSDSQQLGRTPGNFYFSGVTIMLAIFRFSAVFLCLIFLPLLHAQTSGSLTVTPSNNVSGQSGGAAKQRPNILFIIMDDVGIDQMQIF